LRETFAHPIASASAEKRRDPDISTENLHDDDSEEPSSRLVFPRHHRELIRERFAAIVRKMTERVVENGTRFVRVRGVCQGEERGTVRGRTEDRGSGRTKEREREREKEGNARRLGRRLMLASPLGRPTGRSLTFRGTAHAESATDVHAVCTGAPHPLYFILPPRNTRLTVTPSNEIKGTLPLPLVSRARARVPPRKLPPPLGLLLHSALFAPIVRSFADELPGLFFLREPLPAP